MTGVAENQRHITEIAPIGTGRFASPVAEGCGGPISGPVCDIALLSGGQDPHYALGLAIALSTSGVGVQILASPEMAVYDNETIPRLSFLDMYGTVQPAGLPRKIQRICRTYVRLLGYAALSTPRIFHILWNNKIEYFDRTFLMLLYKVLGKKVILTAHNVNAARRDGRDSVVNRLTLTIQYRLADHIFVHTEKMKTELVQQFGVCDRSISVIPYPVNDMVPNTALTSAEARHALGIGPEKKVLLFFGAIKAYKGLEYLVDAFQQLSSADQSFQLIVAGESKKGYEQYWQRIGQALHQFRADQVIQRIAFISDEETEMFFKAADAIVLPYSEIFQSGILFLAYGFGLPAIATNVGSFADDVRDGENGFLCRSRDAKDLARAIRTYFESDLFKNLGERRAEIRRDVFAHHSWTTVARDTIEVYRSLNAAPGTAVKQG